MSDLISVTTNGIPDETEQLFSESVLAEELRKARMLEAINVAARVRSEGDMTSLVDDHDQICSTKKRKIDLTDAMNEPDHVSLFNSYQPYPHSKDFQRVIVTETNEPYDLDTIQACQDISKCLLLRDKWISAHPSSSEDSVQNTTSESEGVHPMNSTHGTNPQNNMNNLHLRRRQDPIYDIFGKSAPPSTEKYNYEMINGVIRVFERNTNIVNMDPRYRNYDINE